MRKEVSKLKWQCISYDTSSQPRNKFLEYYKLVFNTLFPHISIDTIYKYNGENVIKLFLSYHFKDSRVYFVFFSALRMAIKICIYIKFMIIIMKIFEFLFQNGRQRSVISLFYKTKISDIN